MLALGMRMGMEIEVAVTPANQEAQPEKDDECRDAVSAPC